jgi:hypothetical protein
VNATRRVVRLRVPAALAVAVAGVALPLAACTATNPPQTMFSFDPGDGRSGQIGDQATGAILLRNFLVVAQAKGQPGTVIGAIANHTSQQAQVQLAVVTNAGGQQQPVEQKTITLGAGQFVSIGQPAASEGETTAASGRQTVSFDIASMPTAPGAVLTLLAQTAAGGGTSLNIPVLPPVGAYASVLPSASPSETASVASPTVTPKGSGQPTANPSGAAHQTANPSESASPSAS